MLLRYQVIKRFKFYNDFYDFMININQDEDKILKHKFIFIFI
jgi:hypothetical protein